MELPEINLLVLGGTGLVAGILGSLLGVGGGFFIVPILTLVLCLPIKVAIGSSLVTIVATSCTAASIYTGNRLTNIRLGLLLKTATIPGAIIGGLAAAIIAPSILTILFGLILLYTAYTMIMGQYIQHENVTSQSYSSISDNTANSLSTSLIDSYHDQNLGRMVTYKVNHLPQGLGTSFFAGLVSSLLGVGGGIVNVPVLNLIMRVPIKAAIATSSFIIAITATVGAILYHYHGYIYPFIVAPLITGAVIGARLGAELTQKARGVLLRRVFGAFLLITALIMFLRTANVM